MSKYRPITVNGKPFNDAAKWEALQYAMGQVSNMRSAPDTQDELKGMATTSSVSRNLHTAQGVVEKSKSKYKSKIFTVFPSNLIDSNPNLGKKGKTSMTQIAEDPQNRKWVGAIMGAIAANVSDGQLFRLSGNAATIKLLMGYINSTKQSDIAFEVDGAVDGHPERKITVHDLIGVWKKYALNTEKSIIPDEWESYWKEIGQMSETTPLERDSKISRTRALLLMLPVGNFGLVKVYLETLLELSKSGSQLMDMQSLVKVSRQALMRSENECFETSAENSPLSLVMKYLIENTSKIMDCQDVLDYVRVAMNDNEAIEADRAAREAQDAAEAAEAGANSKTPKKPRTSIFSQKEAGNCTAHTGFSTPESAIRTGKAVETLESQWQMTFDSAKKVGDAKKSAMAQKKLTEIRSTPSAKTYRHSAAPTPQSLLKRRPLGSSTLANTPPSSAIKTNMAAKTTFFTPQVTRTQARVDPRVAQSAMRPRSLGTHTPGRPIFAPTSAIKAARRTGQKETFV